jgi:hypothetical protein
MADTIELIKRHTQNLDEYMNKNGKYSFHRFSDGSIHYKAPIFNDISRIEYTCPTPIEPVKELEELKKITNTNDVLVTINDFITFEGWDAILGETGIEFYGHSAEIKYTGIHSLIIDLNHDLKELLQKIKKGYFGDTAFINGVKISTHDLVLLEQELMYFSGDNDFHTHGVYIKYDDINMIADAECRCIYRR